MRIIEAGATEREARAARIEVDVLLIRDEERNRVNIIAARRPVDAVASMDPKFIGKECSGLLRHVLALAAELGLPGLLGVNLRSGENCE
jgi:hypothetical protein